MIGDSCCKEEEIQNDFFDQTKYHNHKQRLDQ